MKPFVEQGMSCCEWSQSEFFCWNCWFPAIHFGWFSFVCSAPLLRKGNQSWQNIFPYRIKHIQKLKLCISQTNSCFDFIYFKVSLGCAGLVFPFCSLLVFICCNKLNFCFHLFCGGVWFALKLRTSSFFPKLPAKVLKAEEGTMQD